jgi:small subunit ribosomal protein S16
MVKIRLTQFGSKNRRTYRIIAIDESDRRNGSAIEILGFYNPLVSPPQLSVNSERVQYWLSVGAQLTDSTKKLLKLSE